MRLRTLGIFSSRAALICAHQDGYPRICLRSWFLQQNRFRGHRLCEFVRKNRRACERIMPYIPIGGRQTLDHG